MSHGFDQFEAEEAITGTNVTPLVDITLVLLIIFMVTATYIVNPAINVELPKAASEDKPTPKSMSVVLTREGKLFLNGRATSKDELRGKVKTAVAHNPDVQVVISADTQLHYGEVVWLLDVVKQLGVRRYALNVRHRDRR